MFLNSHWFKNGQPSKLEGRKKVRLSKEDGFRRLWRLAIFEPVGVQRHNVPHFKGLISADSNPRAQGHDGTFTFCHALVKKSILHLEMATVPFFLNTAVFFVMTILIIDKNRTNKHKKVFFKRLPNAWTALKRQKNIGFVPVVYSKAHKNTNEIVFSQVRARTRYTEPIAPWVRMVDKHSIVWLKNLFN